MMRLKGFVLALTALLLAGCSMMPEYKRSNMPVQENWPQGPAYKAPENVITTTSAADLAWKQFFQSPSLQQLIQSALNNNRDLQMAAANIEAAQALYRVQRADRLPQVDTTTESVRGGLPENASDSGGSITVNSSSLQLGITAFELDVFGRVKSLSEAALQEYLATEQARDAVQIALIANTANAYLSYLANTELLSLTEETLANQQQAFDVIQKRFALGVGTQQDVARAQTTVETAKAFKAQYTRAVAQDKNALELLTGAPVTDDILNRTSLAEVKVLEALPAGLPSDVLLNRPDVKQAEYELKAANANIGAARAALFPKISLTAALGLASADLDELFESNSFPSWTIGPESSVPIFDAGQNKANLDFAIATRTAAVAGYEKAIQSAFREVADELAARGTYTTQLEAQKSLESATKQAYDIAQARYEQGVDNYLTVLDAQRSYFSAQQQTVMVKQARLTNLVNLYKTLGGGLK